MRLRRTWFALGGMLIPAVGAASPDAAPANLLAQDPRLSVKVSVAEKDRPLGEILTTLGREINVPLRAGRDTADDKATLFLDDESAAEVLERIAEQFDLHWSRSGTGYELDQPIASQRREQAAREQELQAQLAAVQVEMERRPPLADTPRRQLEEREAAITQSLRSEDTESRERDRLSEEREAIIEALHPGRG